MFVPLHHIPTALRRTPKRILAGSLFCILTLTGCDDPENSDALVETSSLPTTSVAASNALQTLTTTTDTPASETSISTTTPAISTEPSERIASAHVDSSAATSESPQQTPPAPRTIVEASVTPLPPVDPPAVSPVAPPPPVVPAAIIPPAQEAPAPAPVEQTYYANCKIAKAVGAAPLYVGDPGYRPGLDRDRDGVACEK